MCEIGYSELALVCVNALLVLGPERMPQALRTFGLWFAACAGRSWR
jgi:sec-independent protein translocase protein TatB